MIKVKSLINDLKNMELSGTAFSDSETEEALIPKVLICLNDGLLNMYSKFKLRQDNIVLQTLLGKNLYDLHSDYAISNSNSKLNKNFRYIMDTKSHPFKDNILSISQVYINNIRRKINFPQDPYSVYITNPTQIQIPSMCFGDNINILYYCLPDYIDINDCDYMEKDIDIPKVLEIALRAYIGYNFYNSMAGQEQSAKGIEYYNKYITELQTCKKLNLLNNELDYIDNNFDDMGWK